MSTKNSRKFFRRIAGRRSFGFNMVEVALAMLVISLGLSTVLVLFPAGIKASRQAEEENNLVEAAEAMEAYIRLNHNSLGVDVLAHDSDKGTADTVLDSSFSTTTNANKYKSIIAMNNTTASAFLYRKLTEVDGQLLTEFSCIVRLLGSVDQGIGPDSNNSDDTVGYFPAAASTAPHVNYSSGNIYLKEIKSSNNSKGQVQTINYLQIINMEISYPADKPYSLRKKRVYHLEIFDESHQP